MTSQNEAWKVNFEKYDIHRHDFNASPFEITAKKIKAATTHFTKTGQREPRLLCKQDRRQSRPLVFQDRDLFILHIRNGKYVIVKGEGYVDIPSIEESSEVYISNLDFPLITSTVGNSEMQHLDLAYASSLIRSFMKDDTLVLTIRGRKFTPEFSFYVGHHKITTKSVQVEVDAGYEGKNQVVLVEAKNSKTTNTIIRQLYYPYRQWQHHIHKSGIEKSISMIFFEKNQDEYQLWQYQFTDEENYNSIELVNSKKFQIQHLVS